MIDFVMQAFRSGLAHGGHKTATYYYYEALQAERSIKFFSYDLQTSHDNTLLNTSAAMFTYAHRITK